MKEASISMAKPRQAAANVSHLCEGEQRPSGGRQLLVEGPAAALPSKAPRPGVCGALVACLRPRNGGDSVDGAGLNPK